MTTAQPTPDPHSASTPAAGADPQASGVDREMLEDFLNQHLLGSRSGVKAFRAAAQTWDDTPQGADLTRLGDDVEQDQERLEALIRELGLTTPVPVKAAGVAAEAAGRVNPVNLMRSRGSGWTQVELDLLQGMLQAKAAMWHVLEALAPHEPVLDAGEMAALYERAQDQQRAVQRIAEDTLLERFLR